MRSPHLRKPAALLTAAAGVVGTLVAGGTDLASASGEGPRPHVVCDTSGCLITSWWYVDSDSDGATDSDEIAAGTDPHDPTSRPPLTTLVDLAALGELPSFAAVAGEFMIFPTYDEAFGVDADPGFDLARFEPSRGVFAAPTRAEALTRLGVSEADAAKVTTAGTQGLLIQLEQPTAKGTRPPGAKISYLELVRSDGKPDGGSKGSTPAPTTPAPTTPASGGSGGSGGTTPTPSSTGSGGTAATTPASTPASSGSGGTGTGSGTGGKDGGTPSDGGVTVHTSSVKLGDGTLITNVDYVQGGKFVGGVEIHRNPDGGIGRIFCGSSTCPTDYSDPDAEPSDSVDPATVEIVLDRLGGVTTPVRVGGVGPFSGAEAADAIRKHCLEPGVAAADGSRRCGGVVYVDDLLDSSLFTVATPNTSNKAQPRTVPGFQPIVKDPTQRGGAGGSGDGTGGEGTGGYPGSFPGFPSLKIG